MALYHTNRVLERLEPDLVVNKGVGAHVQEQRRELIRNVEERGRARRSKTYK